MSSPEGHVLHRTSISLHAFGVWRSDGPRADPPRNRIGPPSEEKRFEAGEGRPRCQLRMQVSELAVEIHRAVEHVHQRVWGLASGCWGFGVWGLGSGV